MHLSRTATAYWSTVVLAGLVCLVVRVGVRLAHPVPLEGVVVPTLVALVIVLIAGQHATVEWGPRRKFDLTVGLHYALIVVGAPLYLATPAVALAWALGQGLWLFRRDALGQPRRGWRSVCFNTALAILAVAAGSGAYRHVPAPWGSLAAALVLYGVNTSVVAGMVALHTGHPVWRVWWNDRPWNALVSAAAIAIGSVAMQQPPPLLALALLLLPAITIYVAMRRTQQAQAATHERDDFIRVAAHELRTPLTSLQGYVSLLARAHEAGRPVTPEMQQRALQVVQAQSSRLCGLVDQLLDITALESGTLALHQERVDLSELAAAMRDLLQPLVPTYRLEVHAPKPVMIEADRLRLEQVLTNLVMNAAKYAQGGGHIELEVASGRRAARLIVRDFGIGMDSETRAHVFERYYQATAHRNVNGMGLGLYIAKEIVEAHAGTISCRSSPGNGTEFALSFPPLGRPQPVPAPRRRGQLVLAT